MKENITNFTKNKELFHLTKKRSPRAIKFMEDIADKWFVHVVEYKNKSGEIVNTSLIIAGDIEGWVTHLKNTGWELNITKT